MSAILAAFHRRHAEFYDLCDEKAPAQIVNLRLVVTATTPKPALPTLARATDKAPPGRILTAWLDGAGAAGAGRQLLDIRERAGS